MVCDYIYNTRADTRGKIYARVEISSDEDPLAFPTTGEDVDGLANSITIDTGSILRVLSTSDVWALGDDGNWYRQNDNVRPPASEYDRVWRENYEAPIDVYKSEQVDGYFSSFKMPNNNVIQAVLAPGSESFKIQIEMSGVGLYIIPYEVRYDTGESFGGTVHDGVNLVTIKQNSQMCVLVTIDFSRGGNNVKMNSVRFFHQQTNGANIAGIRELYVSAPNAYVCISEGDYYSNDYVLSDLRSLGVSVKGLSFYNSEGDSYSTNGTLSKFSELVTILDIKMTDELPNGFFSGCKKLRGIPDLSGLKLYNTFTQVFTDCESLKALPRLPDLSKVELFDNLCLRAKSLRALPFGPEIALLGLSSFYNAFKGTNISLFPTFVVDYAADFDGAFYVLGNIDFLQVVAPPNALTKIAKSIQTANLPGDRLVSVMLYGNNDQNGAAAAFAAPETDEAQSGREVVG